MVGAPEQYPWSSFRTNAWGGRDALVTCHALYLQLGATPAERQYVYRELFRAHIDEQDIHAIRQCVAFNHPLGNDRFREQVQTMTGRRVGYAARGRPAACPEPRR